MKLENLIDKEILLRPITLDDTDFIIKWRNAPFVVENFIYRKPLTKEGHVNWFNTKVISGEVIQYIIEIDGLPIGSVYYSHIDKKNHSAEFGIFIGEYDFLGKGYGSRVTKLFVDYGLQHLAFHRICLRALDDNKRAIEAYKKSGFKQEGIARDMEMIDDKYYNIMFMSILDGDSGCLSAGGGTSKLD